jgi:aminomethyltransferase
MSLRTSPLDAEHRARGARLVEFGGWDMPIQYTSVLEEHRACRTDAAVFDVSHLGSVLVRGPQAHGLLQRALTNDLDRIAPGRTQYTHLLDEQDAHVVDDIIVWWVGEDEFLVMPNASNTARIVDALGAGDDITPSRAILAVQGPNARERLAHAYPEAAAVGRHHVVPVELDGASGYVSGTGYTGEDGVELHVPVAVAPAVWDAVLGTGVAPAGLGARDTLRLEAGLPLHGHELGPGITPLQAGLGWVVRWDKGDFRGRAALEAEREHGVARHLVGLLAEGRQIPRAECDVVVDGGPGEGTVVGTVTSGNFSPMLERGIALAFVPPDLGLGADVTIDVRGRPVAATVVDTPFWTH